LENVALPQLEPILGKRKAAIARRSPRRRPAIRCWLNRYLDVRVDVKERLDRLIDRFPVGTVDKRLYALIVYFLPIHEDISRSDNADSHLSSTQFNDCDADVVADNNVFADFP
jgi:hypothetical protein